MICNSGIMIDTDILVDYLRGEDEAVRYLEDTAADFKLSVVNVAGLSTSVLSSEC